MIGQAVLFHGPGEALETVRAEVPDLQGAEILVRITCCTLCRSDLHTYSGRRSEPTPTVLGHEIVGCIEQFGPDARRVDAQGAALAVGDRVVWSVTVGCGQCYFCTENVPQKCERLYKYGHQRVQPAGPTGGGLAEYIVMVPGSSIYQVPPQLTDAVAAMSTCAIATVAAMYRTSGDVANRAVVILGAGALGLTGCAMADAAGARHIVTFDPNATCSERSLAFGATQAINSTVDELNECVKGLTQGRGADVVLEMAGVASAVEAGLAVVRTGGTLVLAGSVSPTTPIALDPAVVVRRMLNIHGVHNYHPRDLRAALTFLAGPGQAYPFASLIDKSFSLGDAEQAFAYALGRAGIRVAVLPGRTNTVHS